MRKLFVFLLLSGAAGLVSANDATIKVMSGTVTIESGGGIMNAVQGQKLKSTDLITVKGGSVAQIVFDNGDVVLVKENSAFHVKEDEKGTLVAFDQGEFLVGLPAKRKGKEMRVQTPMAMASSKSGVFWGKTDAGQTANYAVFAGSLNLLAQEQKVQLKKNQTIQISYGLPPGAPTISKIDPIYVNTFAVNGSLQGVDEMIKGKKR
jgi:hypothetical protein